MPKENQLFEAFQRANRLLKRQIYQAQQSNGEEFSHGQTRLLRILAQQSGASQKTLAEMMRIRPASLSELLTKLEKKGYVSKEQNHKDRRVTNYFLTPQGRTLADSLESVRSSLGVEFFSVLSEDEKASLTEILNKLNQQAE